jgi:predicted nucleic acid-binding protein
VSAPTRGLLDTSVVIDRATIDTSRLPDVWALSAVTFAELSAGPLLTDDPQVRAERQLDLQWAESNVEGVPFTTDTSRIFGQLCGWVRAAGRKPRPKALDLMIAATAVEQDIPLYTRNPKDLKGLEGILTIVDL